MSRADKAYKSMEGRKANCAQSVITAFSEDYGLKKDTAYSIAQAFGGGMHIDGACGAVTGAYMALGLANPVSKENPRASMEKISALMTEFNRKFNELHGSLDCSGLLGYDVTKPEEAAKARESGVFATKCPVFVRDAAAIVETLLNQSGK